jgi:hypothetical protein
MGRKAAMEKPVGEPGHIKRPMNAFRAWSKGERRRMVEEGTSLNNSAMSRVLGERWKGLEEGERGKWKATAERLKKEHAKMYPTYKYKPQRRNSSGNSTSSTVTISPEPLSLYSRSEEGKEAPRPDTPDSLGSLEDLDLISMDDLESNSNMQEIIEDVMARGDQENEENVPPAADRGVESAAITNLRAALTQAAFVPKRTTFAGILGPQGQAPRPQGPATQPRATNPATITSYKLKPTVKPLPKIPGDRIQNTLYRPLILKKERIKPEPVPDPPVSTVPLDPPFLGVDSPRTFPALDLLERGFLGDLERTFATVEALEERRRRGEAAKLEDRHLQFMHRLDTWDGSPASRLFSPFGPGLVEEPGWSLGLPPGWRDEGLEQELDTRARAEAVFVTDWKPKCALKIRKDPYRNLLRTINQRDPKFSVLG